MRAASAGGTPPGVAPQRPVDAGSAVHSRRHEWMPSRSVSEVWQRLLAGSDRFLSIDPAVFLDPRVTSQEYVSRYGTDR